MRPTRAVMLLACAAGLALPRPGRAQQASPPPADFSWALQPLAGGVTTLGAFRGRVLVVNSWATWCEPCVAELQSLHALRAAIPDSGLQVVLVASQHREPVAAFVRRRRVQLPVFLEASPAPAVYRFDVVPTTWIIDRGGRIVLRHRGAMRWDTPGMQGYLRELLAAPSPDGGTTGTRNGNTARGHP